MQYKEYKVNTAASSGVWNHERAHADVILSFPIDTFPIPTFSPNMSRWGQLTCQDNTWGESFPEERCVSISQSDPSQYKSQPTFSLAMRARMHLDMYHGSLMDRRRRELMI